MATGKHFVGYGASEGGLNWAPPHLSWRELRETFLVPFEAAVRLGGMASMMNAYNELDGIPAASSKALLTDLLRGAPDHILQSVKRNAFGRAAEIDDVADVVAMLCGPDARWLTGQIVHADGGL